jgi:hypothetical protein
MTNNQAQSYAALAMKELGYSEKEIKKVTRTMHTLFDEISEEEAEEKAFYY